VLEEFPHELGEIMTGEFPFKRFGDLLEARLEEKDLRGQFLEISVVIARVRNQLAEWNETVKRTN
jgi:hypothetical protein